MSLRIETELLLRLKQRAKAQGRSVSAEVVRLVGKELGPSPTKQKEPTMGMFAHFDAPSLEEFLELRDAATGGLKESSRRRAKRL